MLNIEELERYQRQLALEEVTYAGQKRLKEARILCVGAGGLGSSLSLYLAGAGIGCIGIVDEDTVSLSNLHRQVLYGTSECGLKKTEQAKLRLEALNPNCRVELHNEFLNQENAREILQKYDIIADCSDNFATRYLVNDVCCELNKPNVFASVQNFRGYCTVFPGQAGPCYRCLFDTPPEKPLRNCAESGVLGTVPGVLGTLQANEILKLVLEIGESLIGRVLVFDALVGSFETIRLLSSENACHSGSHFSCHSRA